MNGALGFLDPKGFESSNTTQSSLPIEVNYVRFQVLTSLMEAVRTSETSVDNYFTRQYIPEDNSELHTRRRENLKSHKVRFGR
jgi:hypothetical protein